jgi:hypothetical protein
VAGSGSLDGMDLRLLLASLTGGVALLLVGPGVAVATTGTAPGWRWPVGPPAQVVARFVAPAGPYSPGHRGVDLAAVAGAPVRVAGAGVVAFAGRVAGVGVVSVDHPGGLRTTYEPVTAQVSRGDPVASGDVLGVVEPAGGHCLPATCLHWGLRRGATYLDPLSLLRPARVRLLPVWGMGAGAAAGPVMTGAPGEARPSQPVRTNHRPLAAVALGSGVTLLAAGVLWRRGPPTAPAVQSSEGRSAASRR